MIDLNKVSIGALAGLITGLVVGGIGSRIAMRVVALVAGIPPESTLGGTVGILFLGAFLGVPFGLLFMIGRRFVPFPNMVKGLLYGSILFLIFVLPLFISPEGEFALTSPLTGIIIFGPIPIVFGFMLAIIVAKLETRYQTTAPKQIGAIWFILFGLALVLSFINLASSEDGLRLYYPPAVLGALHASGIRARDTENLRLMLMLTLLLGYWALAIAIFWRGSRSWVAKFAAISLLIFAAAFFNTGNMLSGAMNTLPLVRWFPGVIRVLGFGCLLTLFYILPDGRLIFGWIRPLIVIWWLWLFIWFFNPFSETLVDLKYWPEWLLLAIVVSGLSSGVIAQIIRLWQTTDKQQRQQIKWVMFGCTGTVLSFTVLWVCAVIFPDLKVRGVSGPYTLFAFFLYWTPWFLVPISMVIAISRHQLWLDREKIKDVNMT